MKNKIKFFTILVIGALLISACSSGGFEAETDWEVQDFSYENQRGETVSLDDLKGKVWLADFIFTNCTSVCPPMTFNLVGIQEKLIEEGVEDYQIVGFSVDPEVDKPEVLTDYLTKFNPPDETKWQLLTGYTMDEISKFAKDSFQAIVIDDPNTDQVIHHSAFFLVDKNGIVVKYYPGVEDVPVDEIVSDMKALSKQ
ncbi:SCO family protein [Chungangia koreensis]|uniref:SCO family protein n=1 Tax=Chungangia koreensis TaxID=752657 RepID=A0ABV8X811_9LACT